MKLTMNVGDIVQVNVQYIDASCITGEGELTWALFRKNRAKALRKLLDANVTFCDTLDSFLYTLAHLRWQRHVNPYLLYREAYRKA